jgi:hypothetical protein
LPGDEVLTQAEIDKEKELVETREHKNLKRDNLNCPRRKEIAQDGLLPIGSDSKTQWKRWPEDRVSVFEEGGLVTSHACGASLTHTGEELTAGQHYWEVRLVGRETMGLFVGVCRPDADLRTFHGNWRSTTAWLIYAYDGAIYGNGKEAEDGIHLHEFNRGRREYEKDQGDRLGVLLDLDDGSLRFFKGGKEHGPGYPAGSVTGPVALGVATRFERSTVRLLPDAEWPACFSM